MKNINKTGRFSFLLDLLMDRQIYSPNHTVISSKRDGQIILDFPPSSEPIADSDKKSYLSIYDFPDYLELKILRDNHRQKIFKAPLYSGFAIDLTLFPDLNDYLEQTLTAKKRSRLRGVIRRFEHCIEPEYKIYMGEDISQQECDSLISTLEKMLKERFQQKQEANYELPLMDFYRSVFYKLMLDKKASLYVIYDQGRAISISMNLMLGKTLMLFNSSYDNTYAPFGLGHINMFKNIEWAFKKGIMTIDLGRGDYIHKRRWINKKFTYLELKSGFGGSALATIKASIAILILKARYHIIHILKFFGFQHLYSYLRKLAYQLRRPGGKQTREFWHHTKIVGATNVDRLNLLPVNFLNPDYSFEFSIYIALLHKERLTKKELKPYLLKNKPGELYVEKEDQLYRVVPLEEKEPNN